MKQTESMIAGQIAAQMIQGIPATITRAKQVLTAGVPASANAPAVSVDSIKAALGTENLAVIEAVVTAYDAASATP